MTSTFADYRAVLTMRGARLPIVASAISRLPVPMFPIATLLYVQPATGSFVVAGLVSAGLMAGVALGSVIKGRILDRLRPSRPLLISAVAFAVVMAGLVWAIETHQPAAAMIALAVLAGLVEPPIPAASRMLWTVLIPPGPRRATAFSYEAISFEAFFVLGPTLAALLVAAPWQGTGLVVGTAALTVGTVMFALSPVVWRQEAVPAPAGRSGMLGVIARPGMQTLVLAALGFGLVVGTVQVGVTAATTAAGNPTMGGVLLSMWAIASVVAGFAYSLRPWPHPLNLRLPALLAAFGLMGAVLAAAAAASSASLVPLIIAVLAAGALVTPQLTAQSLAVELACPAGTAAEGFGWVITAATIGIAAGSSIGGLAVEQAGPPAAFLTGAAAAVAAAALLWARRESLADGPVPAAAQ